MPCAPPSRGEPDAETPVEPGAVERVGVSLAMIDVEVVDDLCQCPEPERVRTVVTSETPAPAPPAPGQTGTTTVGDTDDIYESTPERFILYLDFSQLQLDGRARAVAEAKRWTRDGMKPGDEAMVMACSTAAGLRELTGFTESPEELSAVIDEACEMAELIDPFPSQYDRRKAECDECCPFTCDPESGCGWCESELLDGVDCCPLCADHASREYFHGRRSLKALRRLPIDLQRKPGRKQLLLFHQNGSLYPARSYPVREDSIGDHVAFVEEIAAEATPTRCSPCDVLRAASGPISRRRRSARTPGGYRWR